MGDRCGPLYCCCDPRCSEGGRRLRPICRSKAAEPSATSQRTCWQHRLATQRQVGQTGFRKCQPLFGFQPQTSKKAARKNTRAGKKTGGEEMKTGHQPLEGYPARWFHWIWRIIHFVCVNCQTVSRGKYPFKNVPADFVSTAARRKGQKQFQALTPTVNLARGSHWVGTRLSCL